MLYRAVFFNPSRSCAHKTIRKQIFFTLELDYKKKNFFSKTKVFFVLSFLICCLNILIYVTINVFLKENHKINVVVFPYFAKTIFMCTVKNTVIGYKL